MDTWLRISLLLCTFGFCRELRPSDPFQLVYLSERFNTTSQEIFRNVFPLATYAQLGQLVIIFMVTDMLRYKPIIVISASASIVIFAIALWAKTVKAFQIAQLFYGTLMASEVAYYTYIYAKVEKDRYQIVTGHTRAAILCGKFVAGMLGQLLLSTGTTHIRELFYISFSSELVSLIIAIALPSVSKSLYFHSQEQQNEKTKSDQHAVAVKNLDTHTVTAKVQTAAVTKLSWRNTTRLLFQHTMSAYSKPVVVQWSIWWALATGAQLQVINYSQFLWKEMDPNQESYYNGAVEATVTLLGAAGAMAAGLMNSSRHKQWHWWILTICSLLMGTFLITAAITNAVIVAYVMYVLFGMTYFFVITIASATVAKNLSDDCFGLIFGINTLVAVGLQALLTVVVISVLGSGLREQFIIYGGYFIVLACSYFMALLIKCIFGSHKAKYILK